MSHRSTSVWIEGRDLHLMVQRVGRGQPLLFIGGTGWDLRQHPNPTDSILAQAFDLLHFDQRGMGRSDKPPGPYTMVDFAEDAAALLHTVGVARAHIVGYSFGGMVAQELAIRWPDRIISLVLAATTAGGEGGSSYPIERFLDLPADERARRGLEIADLTFTPEWQAANPEEARRRIEARMVRQTQYGEEAGTRSSLRAQLEARAGHDAFDRLHLIEAPTLVLTGSCDGQAPLTAQKAMAHRIAGSRMEVVPGSHNFIFENEGAYQAIMRHCLG